MNKKLLDFKKIITSKKVAVIGIGISNTPLIKYLAGMGVRITAFDMSEPERINDRIVELKPYNVEFNLGINYLDKLVGYDIIFKTPVIRPDLPQILKEKERGAIITSEMEVFINLCPAQTIAITGSEGKTTTTILIHEILQKSGYRCRIGGNIGIPLLDRIDEIDIDEKIILELSSFQLQTMSISPDVAVITNISPNHLDVHKDYQEYIDAKKNIIRFQNKNGKLILNYDNLVTRSFSKEAKGEVLYFSRKEKVEKGCFLNGNKILYNDGIKSKEIIDINKILIPGLHNIENYMAAITSIQDLCDKKSIRRVAGTFKGVEHRIEHVRDFKGISFYNDSKASSPSSTVSALNSFQKKVILIAGGKDKNNDYDQLSPYLAQKVKCLVLMGQTADLIEKTIKKYIDSKDSLANIKIIRVNSMQEAVRAAYNEAVKNDIVLLSPASTSFDLYKNFEERGEDYKKIVNSIQ